MSLKKPLNLSLNEGESDLFFDVVFYFYWLSLLASFFYFGDLSFLLNISENAFDIFDNTSSSFFCFFYKDCAAAFNPFSLHSWRSENLCFMQTSLLQCGHVKRR